MKIFVSPKMFESSPNYEIPMAQAGICDVDRKLKLEQIVVECDDGAGYLIEMSVTGNMVTKLKKCPHCALWYRHTCVECGSFNEGGKNGK